METNRNALDPEEQLRVADRATTLAWTEYPTLPRWSFPVMGAFCGLYLVALHGSWLSLAWSLVWVVLSLVQVVFVVWMTRRRGASARMISMPKEFRPVAMWYLVGLFIIVTVGMALIIQVSPLVGGVLVAVASAIGLDLYVRRYEAVAADVRARVGKA